MLIFQIAFVFCLIYLYLVWNFQYWKNRNVPSAKAYPLCGSFPKSFFQHLNICSEQYAMYKCVFHSQFVIDFVTFMNFFFFCQSLFREYRKKARFVGVMSGRTPQLLILDNSLVKDILIKDFKNFHDNEIASLVIFYGFNNVKQHLSEQNFM